MIYFDISIWDADGELWGKTTSSVLEAFRIMRLVPDRWGATIRQISKHTDTQGCVRQMFDIELFRREPRCGR